MKRVTALYARVSTEDQARHGASLPAQLQACRQLTDDSEDVKEYVDGGVSADTLDRPSLSALRAAVQRREVDRIVVLDPDRLSRRLIHQLVLADEFERAGASLEFVNFTWQDTPEGRLFFNLRGAIAEFEREKIRERAQRGWNMKADRGQLVAGMQRYGYRYDAVAKTLSEDPETAPIVREIYRLAADERLSTGRIAARLSAAGVPAPRGHVWWRDTVSKILRNPAYAGEAVIHRYQDRRNSRDAPLTDSSAWVTVSVPALVDDATWARAHGVIQRHRKFWKGRGTIPMLLRRLVRCGRCGHDLSTNVRVVRGVEYRYYFCPKRYARKFDHGETPAVCRMPWIPADQLETAVWNDVKELFSDPAAWEQAVEAVAYAPHEDSGLAATQEHLDNVLRARERLLALVRDDLITLQDARQQLSSLKRQEHELRMTMHKPDRSSLTLRQRIEKIRTHIGTQPDWDALPFSLRVDIVRELIDFISVDTEDGVLQIAVTFMAGSSEE